MAAQAGEVLATPGAKASYTAGAGGDFGSVFVDATDSPNDVLVGLDQGGVNGAAVLRRVKAGTAKGFPIPPSRYVSFLVDPSGTAPAATQDVYWAAAPGGGLATTAVTAVSVLGGTVTVGGSVYITNASLAVTGTVAVSGTVTIAGSVNITNASLTVTGTVAVSGTVTIAGSVNITNASITVSGSVSVSNTVTVSGSVTVTNSSIAITIDGSGNTVVIGNATTSPGYVQAASGAFDTQSAFNSTTQVTASGTAITLIAAGNNIKALLLQISASQQETNVQLSITVQLRNGGSVFWSATAGGTSTVSLVVPWTELPFSDGVANSGITLYVTGTMNGTYPADVTVTGYGILASTTPPQNVAVVS